MALVHFRDIFSHFSLKFLHYLWVIGVEKKIATRGLILMPVQLIVLIVRVEDM